MSHGELNVVGLVANEMSAYVFDSVTKEIAGKSMDVDVGKSRGCDPTGIDMVLLM